MNFGKSNYNMVAELTIELFLINNPYQCNTLSYSLYFLSFPDYSPIIVSNLNLSFISHNCKSSAIN